MKKITKTHKKYKKYKKYYTTLKTKSKAPCEVCNIQKLTGSNAIYKLKSGDTHLRQYLPPDNTPTKSTDVRSSTGIASSSEPETVILKGLKPNTTIFFFASNTPNPDFTASISPFKKAYGHLENSGVARTDNNGQVSFKINCPRVYLAEDGEVYSRHIHWIYWNNKSKSWGNDIYTHQIFCNVDKKFVKKYAGNSSKKVILIDALSEESYRERHIPGAVNLPASKKWSLDEVMRVLPSGTHSTTPMIIYCYSPECTAGEKLWIQLNKLGFYNTMHYSGGISNWFS
jgi:rhodanese-related sulfurtransferase